jgi:hypothetical protein
VAYKRKEGKMAFRNAALFVLCVALIIEPISITKKMELFTNKIGRAITRGVSYRKLQKNYPTMWVSLLQTKKPP